jgi:hypothetical protein
LAHYHQENYEEALHYGELASRTRGSYLSLRVLLATLGQLGRTADAQPILREFLPRQSKDPQRLFETTTPYLNPKHREHLADGLRRAGVPNLQ